MDFNKNQILLEKAKAGDEEATALLMETNLGLVRSIAYRFKDRGVDYEDLVQIGCIGMLKAIRSFDMEKSTAFSDYATLLVIGEIKRFTRAEKDLLQIKKTCIDIGLKKEYKFFQISDIHLSYCDENSSELDKNEHEHFHNQWDTLKVDFANQFGEFCDERYDVEPTVLFGELCNHALEIGADALILSGDIVDRVTRSNIEYLKEIFKTISIPIIYCPGNHEHMDENGNKFDDCDARIKEILPKAEFDSIELDEFKVIAIDNGGMDVNEKQLELLKAELQGDKRILLIQHKPLNLGCFGKELLDKIGSYFFMGTEHSSNVTKEFVELINQNSEKFIAVLCGHIHAAKEYEIANGLLQISTSSGLIGACREIIIK